MTVAQLIEALKRYPSDWPVLVSGCEIELEDIQDFDHISSGDLRHIKSEKVVLIG